MKTDTHPEIEKMLMERYKLLSGEERVKMATSMFDCAREIVISSIRNKNPHISEDELNKELVLRFYGSDFSRERMQDLLEYL